jgi:hypothetical protein
MDKFFKFHGLIAWEPAGDNPNVFIGESTIVFGSCQNTEKWTEISIEEFTAAALQAIEKLKAQGIDIGTNWLPKWEPKPGEVVCAWDNRNGEGFIVAKFVSKSDGIFPYTLSNDYAYQFIAPFSGEIPEPFKTRWEAEGNGPA